jgi:hypothetical protein
VFFLHGEDARGKAVLREKLTRERLLPFLANQAVSTIAMEAGCGAHQWARAFSRLGHQVRVIHLKFVRPFVKRIDQREGLAPTGFAGSWPGEEGKSPRSHCKNAHIAWRLLSHETFYEEPARIASTSFTHHSRCGAKGSR